MIFSPAAATATATATGGEVIDHLVRSCIICPESICLASKLLKFLGELIM